MINKLRDLASGPAGLAASAVLLVAAAVVGHRSLGGNVADLDSFYHFGHVARLLDVGIFDTSLPQARFSAVGDLGADMWWGFHLLLIPFVALGSIQSQLFWAGVVLTSTLLLGVLWLLREHRVYASAVWPLVFFAAVPNVMYRHLMVRPHLVSLLAGLVMLSFLVRGRRKHAAIAAGVLTWLHLGMFWLVPVVAGAYLVASVAEAWRFGESEAWKPSLRSTGLDFGAVAGGALLGGLLRPHPIAALRLADIQVLKLLRERDLPLNFGGDILPLPPEALFPSSWLLLVPWLLAAVWAVIAYVNRSQSLREMSGSARVLLLSSLLLSVGFLVLTLVVANRALLWWTAFGVLSLALTLTHLVGDGSWRRNLVTLQAVVTLLALPWIGQWHRLNVELNGEGPSYLREAAVWLAENVEPGEVVFHAHWDNFGPLLAWNGETHFVGGMDPIFQYAHSPDLYWKAHHLARGSGVSTTCGSNPCAGDVVDVHQALVEDFDAAYFLVEGPRNPELFDYLRADDRFDLVRYTGREGIFEILR